MLKKSCLFVSAFLLGSLANAAVVFGDVAIIGYQHDNGGGVIDEFSIVLLNDFMAGDAFFFSDAEVNGTNLESDGDTWRVTANSTINAGTVITFTVDGSSFSTAADVTQLGYFRSGSGSPVSIYGDSRPGASITSSEEILLFSSTDDGATIANSTNLFYLDGNSGDTPSGLTVGNGLLRRNTPGVNDSLSNSDTFAYNGITTGSASVIFTAISDISNWGFFTPGSGATNQVGSVVIPEPSTYAMIAGLLALGIAARRRRRARRA